MSVDVSNKFNNNSNSNNTKIYQRSTAESEARAVTKWRMPWVKCESCLNKYVIRRLSKVVRVWESRMSRDTCMLFYILGAR